MAMEMSMSVYRCCGNFQSPGDREKWQQYFHRAVGEGMGGMGYLGYKDLAGLQGVQLDPPDPVDLLDPLDHQVLAVGGPSTPGGGRVPAHKWKAPS